MPDTVFFSAHHSPVGAFASFTLGMPGAKGGLAAQVGRPANQSVFIGVESADPGEAMVFDALPFFSGAEDEAKRYEVEQAGKEVPEGRAKVRAYPREAIARRLTLSTDTWTAGDLTFRVISPAQPVPDPEAANLDHHAMALAVCPAVLVELEVDNREGSAERTAYFGYQGNDPYAMMHRLEGHGFGAGHSHSQSHSHGSEEGEGGLCGVGQGRITAIATDAEGAVSGGAFSIEKLLDPLVPENRNFGLGGVGGVLLTAPAGQRTTFRFAVCFYNGGVVTSGRDCCYLYTRYFDRIETVAAFALEHFDALKAKAAEADALLEDAASGGRLSDDQRFLLAHAVHSYYGSTQLLDIAPGSPPDVTPGTPDAPRTEGRKPYWVVNEGEYRMMNTFDLTVDQLFYEIARNPWTVRNELDIFVERYSYRDHARLPGDRTDHPGGLSFTHDQGVANHISRPEYSTYELFGLDGCFSHMTHEQLCNFVLCAGVYLTATDDADFLDRHAGTLTDCLTSMVNRDHIDPEQRDGIMSLDSSRCMGGAEITTYDSLDESLGQARNNVYMAVKCWASYLLLEKLLGKLGKRDAAATAKRQADRAAASIASAAGEDGELPAVMFEPDNPGHASRIIPAIEGLVFPYVCGMPEAVAADGPYAELIAALAKHVRSVTREGVCLFDDGGWKLSSTSDNSWLSKIFLSQFVWRQILGLPWGETGTEADAAHVHWLVREESAYYAFSDQIVAGVAKASLYYPRGVTAWLWLSEGRGSD